MSDTPPRKAIHWVGGTKNELSSFPRPVKEVLGYALYLAQTGGKHPKAKPLTGFDGALIEARENSDGEAYRIIYCAKLGDKVEVLHVFLKKSHSGNKTPKADIELIKARYADLKKTTKKKKH